MFEFLSVCEFIVRYGEIGVENFEFLDALSVGNCGFVVFGDVFFDVSFLFCVRLCLFYGCYVVVDFERCVEEFFCEIFVVGNLT